MGSSHLLNMKIYSLFLLNWKEIKQRFSNQVVHSVFMQLLFSIKSDSRGAALCVREWRRSAAVRSSDSREVMRDGGLLWGCRTKGPFFFFFSLFLKPPPPPKQRAVKSPRSAKQWSEHSKNVGSETDNRVRSGRRKRIAFRPPPRESHSCPVESSRVESRVRKTKRQFIDVSASASTSASSSGVHSEEDF